jgi:hypothetical protein
MIARIILVLLVSALNCWGGSLTLSKTFVEKVKNAAIIETDFSVDHTLKKPHRISSGGDDGDIHASGRDTAIQLPLVVEIANAGMESQKPAMDAMIAAEGTAKIPLAGTWRLWFEHAGKDPQIQGKKVPKPDDTNPDHVFELHPLSAVNGNDCTPSFQVIPDYDAYDAQRAFAEEYEKLSCTIRVTGTAIQIESKKAGINYTQFRMQLVGKPKKGTDNALFVLANVFDINDEEEKMNTSPVRMVFVDGTPAAQAVAELHDGDRMNLLGIPRVDLSKVSVIAKGLAANKTFKGPLPYEIIVMAQLPESP